MRSFFKIFSIFLFLIVLSASLQAANNKKSLGIGGQYSWVLNYVHGPGLTVKIGNFPVIGANFNIWDGGLAIGATVDGHIWNPPLGPFFFYFGVGGGANIFLSSTFQLNAGVRFPLGLQWFPVNWLEIFFEIPPTIGFGIGLGAGYDKSNSGFRFLWGLGATLGVRFYVF